MLRECKNCNEISKGCKGQGDCHLKVCIAEQLLESHKVPGMVKVLSALKMHFIEAGSRGFNVVMD